VSEFDNESSMRRPWSTGVLLRLGGEELLDTEEMGHQGMFPSDCFGKYVMTAWIHNSYKKHNAKQKVDTEFNHNRLRLSK